MARSVIVGRWWNNPNIEEGGIYWADAETVTLFDYMQRYLTRGEVVEILSYNSSGDPRIGGVYTERLAHKEKNDALES